MKTIFVNLTFGFRCMQIALLAAACISLASLGSCEDDPIVQHNPRPPVPSWWPGNPFADSVTYLDDDSLILHGHFVPLQSTLDIIEYFFLLHEHGPGISNYTVYMLEENTQWQFSSLETVISEIKVPHIKPGSGAVTDFTLNIEVVNPRYKTGDPILTRTYYLVSNVSPVSAPGD